MTAPSLDEFVAEVAEILAVDEEVLLAQDSGHTVAQLGDSLALAEIAMWVLDCFSVDLFDRPPEWADRSARVIYRQLLDLSPLT